MQKGHSTKRICRIWNKVNNVCCPSSRKDKKKMPSFQQGIFSRDSGLGISGQFINEEIPFIFFCLFFLFSFDRSPQTTWCEKGNDFQLEYWRGICEKRATILCEKVIIISPYYPWTNFSNNIPTFEKVFIDIQKNL